MMNISDKLTACRVIFAPVFFLIYFAPKIFPAFAPVSVPFLWILFIGIELTDMFDGKIARKQGIVSDFGKLFDPFADTFAWLTFFFCFVLSGVLPGPWSFIVMLVIFYREYAILFLRNLMLRKGVTQGARKGGKTKAIFYMVTGIVSLIAVTIQRFHLSGGDYDIFKIASYAGLVFFVLSMIMSVVSFFDYIQVYRGLK
jgi:CDP-diacylglycerol--glycerol-3-phosphate 3-phosphatidyltransferase